MTAALLAARKCGTCGRREGRLPLRVFFTGRVEARVVCDGCLETKQRLNDRWAYCYLPRSVRS